MEKVIYSVTKLGKNSTKMSGVGIISEGSLVTAAISANKKAYVRVFEDAVKNCHLIPGETDCYKGFYEEYRTGEVEDEKGAKTEIEFCTDYAIWYKILKEER